VIIPPSRGLGTAHAAYYVPHVDLVVASMDMKVAAAEKLPAVERPDAITRAH
jgi:hypothetical protein